MVRVEAGNFDISDNVQNKKAVEVLEALKKTVEKFDHLPDMYIKMSAEQAGYIIKEEKKIIGSNIENFFERVVENIESGAKAFDSMLRNPNKLNRVLANANLTETDSGIVVPEVSVAESMFREANLYRGKDHYTSQPDNIPPRFRKNPQILDISEQPIGQVKNVELLNKDGLTQAQVNTQEVFGHTKLILKNSKSTEEVVSNLDKNQPLILGANGKKFDFGEYYTNIGTSQIPPQQDEIAQLNQTIDEVREQLSENNPPVNKWQEFVQKNNRLIGGAEAGAGIATTIIANNARRDINKELSEKELGGQLITFGDRAKQVTAHLAILGGVAMSVDGLCRTITNESAFSLINRATGGARVIA